MWASAPTGVSESFRQRTGNGGLFHALHRQADAAALLVDIEDGDLDHVADGDDLGRVLDEFAADLRDMHKAVLMNADVHKDAEVNDVAHRPAQDHAGLQIL